MRPASYYEASAISAQSLLPCMVGQWPSWIGEKLPPCYLPSKGEAVALLVTGFARLCLHSSLGALLRAWPKLIQ